MYAPYTSRSTSNKSSRSFSQLSNSPASVKGAAILAPLGPTMQLGLSVVIACEKEKVLKVFDNSAFQYKGQKKRDQGNESFLFCNKLIHKCSSWLADYMNLKKKKFISRCCFERNAEAVCVPITIFSLIVAFLKHKENVYAVIEMCIFSL